MTVGICFHAVQCTAPPLAAKLRIATSAYGLLAMTCFSFSCAENFFFPQHVGVCQILRRFFSKNFQPPQVVPGEKLCYNELKSRILGKGAEFRMLQIEKAHIHKLLCAQNPDAALLYLYLADGGDPQQAAQKLGYTESRYACAWATLRQLGLWTEPKEVRLPGEPPRYTEEDVIRAMDTDMDFRALRGEIQRLLGKNLTTEELRILIGFVRYLGLPSDVIVLLVCHCKDEARKLGSKRNPSLLRIEKEAYKWAEKGIDTMEEAAAYVQRQSQRFSQVGRIMELLQIRGRNLTAPEKRYMKQWLEMGFEEEAIGLAYERSCLNTGGLAWPYMNKILTSWHGQGLHTVQEIRGERKPAVPKGASGQLGDAELAAIQKLMKEG